MTFLTEFIKINNHGKYIIDIEIGKFLTRQVCSCCDMSRHHPNYVVDNMVIQIIDLYSYVNSCRLFGENTIIGESQIRTTVL